MAKKPYLGSLSQRGTLLDSFRESVQIQVDRTTTLPSLWVCKNFKHPKDSRIPWSFINHEFQIEIIDDQSVEMCVKKCAQIGLSTLQILWLLTFCAQHHNLKIAYVLPTAKFATEFSSIRLQPIIDASPAIAGLVSMDVDNVGAKKIGTCFMVMRGTSGESQAISIDLDAIVTDEINFCNQKTLSAMESRLQHSDLKLKRKFSTPTLPGYGISSEYNSSSKAIRKVKCEHCETWVIIDFFKDVVIPGFDKPMKDYRKGDHLNPKIMEAYYKCPSCAGVISEGVLNDPSRREWVHEHTDRDYKGYHVRPWDVPKYNGLSQILMSIKDRTYQDWCNFVIGEDHQDTDNSFSLEQVGLNSILPVTSLDRLYQGNDGIYGVYIGADLGKTNHIAIGVQHSSGRLAVIGLGRIDTAKLISLYGEANFGKFLYDLAIRLHCRRIVIDHAPSWEPALYLHGHLQGGMSYGAYYEGDRAGQLDIYNFDDSKGVVKINRTKHFDDLSQAVNSGAVLFPSWDDGLNHEMTLMRAHLDVLKKMKRINSKGQTEEYWDSTSDEDHYGHALGYLWTAYTSVERRYVNSPLILPPSVRGVQYGVQQQAYNL